MPVPKTLLEMTTGANAVIPPQSPQVVPVNVPAVQSQPTPNTALAIPAAFGQLATIPSAEELPSGGSATIYGFYNTPNSKQFANAIKVGANDGDAVVMVEGKLHACKPLKFFLAMASAFRTGSDDNGNIVAASLDALRYTNETPDEHYVTLILVEIAGKLVPCKFDFKGTKSSAAREAIAELHASTTPEWAAKSVAHKATLSFQIPWGRVFNEVTTSRRVGKKGLPYFATDSGGARPASPDEMKMLAEFASSQDNLDLFSRIQAEYENRCDEIRKKVRK